MATARPTKAAARLEKKAALEAAQAREARARRTRVVAVVVAGLLVVGGVAALAFTGGSDTKGADGTAYSSAKEAFRLPGLLDATPVALADHKGTPTVVNFFASWCVYCNEELPGFVQVAKATSGKVDFVGIDTSDPGDGAAMARRFDLAGVGFSLGKDIGADPASELWTSFGGQGLPVTAFYDASGKLVDFAGGMLPQADLEKRLKSLYGVDVTAPDAQSLVAPVIPLIPQGASELLTKRPGGQTFLVIDLRGASAYAAGHLPGAANLEPAAVPAAIAKLDKAASYLVYDADGSGSTAVATALHDAGFKHVYDLTGGFAAWVGQGLETTTQ